uniref:ATMDAR2 n=1 Tax=Arundo donax TaxID=35708 RepID=A0A0A9DDI0_ARUDO
MVNVFHSPQLIVHLQGEGGHIANGIYSRNTCFKESVSLRKIFRRVRYYKMYRATSTVLSKGKLKECNQDGIR